MSDGPVPDPADWRASLIGQFNDCAAAIDAKIAGSALSDDDLGKLIQQRGAYRASIANLQLAQFTDLLSQAPDATKSLQDAATAAQKAAAAIKGIANSVALAASLLVLATAIATTVTTGNPSGLVAAAEGVIKAAKPFLGSNGAPSVGDGQTG
jgi:hypothetical protein